jgi:nucleoside-diphosphate-sugar epimerase
MKRLAVTGFPGWLSSGLLDDLVAHPEACPEEILFLVHPPMLETARELAAAYPWKHTVVPFELTAVQSLHEPLSGIDTLVHTAGIIHVKRTRDWYDVNTKGTIELASQAKRAGVGRLVFVSSIAAAGKSWRDRSLIESDRPRPMHHYGKSKLLAERALIGMWEPGAFNPVILRPPMFYGPPVPTRHIEIYRRILHGRMPLIGGGKYNRSLVHIVNLTQGVRLAMTSPRAGGQTYFITDRPVYTTFSVVEAMAEALGTKARYLHIPALLAETAYQADRAMSALGLYVAPIHLVGESHWHQSASCDKAIQELGYQPTIELSEGMHQAIEWCRRKHLL